MPVLTDTTLAAIEYRGYIIQPQEIRNETGSVIRCAYAVLNTDGTPTGAILRNEDTARQHINQKIARLQAFQDEALARAIAPIVRTNAQKLGRRAIDAHPLI